MWGCWNSDAFELFRRMDMWEKTCHNPKAMLEVVSQEHLIELSQDDSFVSHKVGKCGYTIRVLSQ